MPPPPPPPLPLRRYAGYLLICNWTYEMLANKVPVVVIRHSVGGVCTPAVTPCDCVTCSVHDFHVRAQLYVEKAVCSYITTRSQIKD